MKKLSVLERLYYRFFERERYGAYKRVKARWRSSLVVVSWNTREGKKRLARARYKQAFFRLAHHFQPQINPFYCSVASMVSALNALRVSRGVIPEQPRFQFTTPDGRLITYRLYSQLTLLDTNTDQVKPKEVIAPSINPELAKERFDPGLMLRQVEEILTLYGVQVERQPAEWEEAVGQQQLRALLKSQMNRSDTVVIANFFGRVQGLASQGHYSLLAAYDEETDSVLVLDTASHKNPWYWTSIRNMYRAMHTKDNADYRGWLVLKDGVS